MRQPRSVLAPLALAAALAASFHHGVYAQAPQATSAALPLAIAAQPLGAALNELARQAGLQLLFAPALVAGRTAPAVAGRLTPLQALDRLLAGSGLVAVPQGQAIVVQPAGDQGVALPAVTVVGARDAPGSAQQAYRAETASAGVLGEVALQDTPFSIEVVPRELLANQQSASLVEALRNDASVTPTTNAIGGLSSQVAMRGIGLDLLDGRKIDGLNVFSWSSDLPLEHFEELQVLKGAGGFLYGFAQPGGIVNFVTKRPTDAPTRSILASVTGSGTALAAVDLGGRFGEDARFGYRANLVGEGGDTYVRHGGRIDRQSGSLALDWRIAPGLVWSADLLAMNRRLDGSTSWGLFPNASGGLGDFTAAPPPAAIPGSRRIYSPFTQYETRGRVWGSAVDWAFAPDWNARLSYRGSTMDRIYANGSIYANAAGAYTEELYTGTDNFRTQDLQALVTGRINTGPVAHSLAFGSARNAKRSYYSSVSGYAVLGSGVLAHPGDFGNPGLTPGPADTLGSDVVQRAWFASDTLHLGELWDLVLGLRRSSVKDSLNGYDRAATTPTLAAIHKPSSWLSTYVSYTESLEQGATAPVTAANAHEVFPPLRSKQLELGVKAQQAQWSASAALFRIERGLAFTDAGNRFSQEGRARYDGLELSAKARVQPAWMLGASALFLDAKNTEADNGLQGRRVQGAPRRQLAAYTEYRVAADWVLSAGVQHYGARPVDAAATVLLPAYALLDAGLRYTTRLGGTRSTWRLNVDNLANKAYWQASAGYLTQGAPRTVKLGAQFDF
jgi:iron complex outermembrane receptor protein